MATTVKARRAKRKRRRIGIQVPWQEVRRRQKDNMSLVYAMIRRILPHLGPSDEDWHDAVQLGRITLWECSRRFDKNKGVTFATYTCKSLVRRFRRFRAECLCRGFTGIVGTVEDGRMDAPPAAGLVAEDLRWPDDRSESELPVEVDEAIATLDARQQEVLVARFFRGETYRRLAKVHGVTHERVRQILLRGVEKIQEHLGLRQPPPPPRPPVVLQRCRCGKAVKAGGPNRCPDGKGCRRKAVGR